MESDKIDAEPNKDIKDIIKSESDYFDPIIEREKKVSQQVREKWRQETVAQRSERVSLEVYDLLQGIVKHGPFEGMQLQKAAWWGRSDLGSMLLGLYEKEILDYIGSLKKNQFSTFIDIGAADGYYACGLLYTGKVKRAICFEKSAQGRSVIEENWINNGEVGELSIKGEADFESIVGLRSSELSDCLVIIDIEGHEFDLMNEGVLSHLSSCVVIIEVHNWVDDFMERYKNLLVTASNYFKVEIMDRMERPTLNFPELRDFTDDNRLLLVSERRPCVMRFLKLTPLMQEHR